MMYREYDLDNVCLCTINISGYNGILGRIISALTRQEIPWLYHSADFLT